MQIFIFPNLALAKHMLNVADNFFNFVFPTFCEFIKNLAAVFLRVNFFNLVLFDERFASESKIGFFYANFAYEKTWGTHPIFINEKHNFLIDFNIFLVPPVTHCVGQNSNFKKSPCKILSLFHAFSIYFIIFFGKQIFNKINLAAFFLPIFLVWVIFIP